MCEPNRVTISAVVLDPAGVSGVKLTYRVVEGTREGDWLALPMKQTATSTYGATVRDEELEKSLDPPLSVTSARLEYYVQAFDGEGNPSESSVYTVTIVYCLI